MKIPNFYKGLFKYQAKKPLENSNYNITALNNLVDVVVDKLVKMNGYRVLTEIKKGNKNVNNLLSILADWSNYLNNNNRIITFIGTRLTTDCNLMGKDRCVYCDQKYISEKASLEDYKKFMDDLYKNTVLNNFYYSISGGEPMLWAKKLYGKNGLIAYLNSKGTYININSNLHLLNTDNVVDLINSGINSIRVSFDVSDELKFDDIVTEGAFTRTLFSIYLLIRYKQLLNSNSPRIFYNVVATSINVNGFGDLIDFLINFLNDHQEIMSEESIRNLMSVHLIPLGGEKNRYLMPTNEDWSTFINKTIPYCENKWKEFLNKNNLDFFDFDSFGNPLNQNMYKKPVNEIIENFVNEQYNKNVKMSKCHCSPTQIYILPNGNVYPCSCHAERLSKCLGNIKTDNYNDILERNLEYLNSLPNEYCTKCPISVVKMNVRVEEKLIEYIKSNLA
ncbi:radical SAM protein [Clostridium sp. 'deep sea']|uniref:radical SAM protein n=1 Tax=Clostridium sp. 'deep sea' TaxID=2779445 RepID=UPI001896875C|nr:SPASM domain-containing protein [Clostridium sp. 'deep sea']QOR33670.1 radical SAM protein [Clostridium sp. 'deep sea']